MRHLFIDWQHISTRLRSACSVALFLDFDGTLARFQHRPDEVSLDGPVRQALAALARSPRFRIWVISGRRQADVHSRIRVPGIRYLGLQGWECEKRSRSLAEETRRCLLTLSGSLLKTGFQPAPGCLADIPGLWIEDKEFAFAVHYGGVATRDLPRARAMLHRIVQPCSQRFRIQHGKNVWEILPRELEDKGAAARQQLAHLRCRSLPIYLGDDQVDEPAFAALRHGITVRIGNPGRTRARYRLSGVPEVRQFLQKLRSELT